MIRVTKLTDYGIAMMTHLAGMDKGHQITAPDLSRDMDLPLPTVRKILKRLTRQKLLVSTRGISGGYCLACDPGEITLLDMVNALEGPVALTECATGDNCGCDMQVNCGLQENWSWVNQLLQRTLGGFTLAQMQGSLADVPMPGLALGPEAELPQRFSQSRG